MRLVDYKKSLFSLLILLNTFFCRANDEDEYQAGNVMVLFRQETENTADNDTQAESGTDNCDIDTELSTTALDTATSTKSEECISEANIEIKTKQAKTNSDTFSETCNELTSALRQKILLDTQSLEQYKSFTKADWEKFFQNIDTYKMKPSDWHFKDQFELIKLFELWTIPSFIDFVRELEYYPVALCYIADIGGSSAQGINFLRTTKGFDNQSIFKMLKQQLNLITKKKLDSIF